MIGCIIEFYSSVNDPDLTEALATTNIISQNSLIYRFDFLSIYTYSGSFATADSIAEIASDAYAITEDAIIPKHVNITDGLDIIGYLDITGDKAVCDVNIIDALYGKQGTIADGYLSISKTLKLQSSLETLQTNTDLKQDIINDGDLNITQTLNIQSSLETLQTNIDLKQNINDVDLNITQTSGLENSLETLQTNIDTKQDIINDDDVNTSQTLNLQSSLNTLQSNID